MAAEIKIPIADQTTQEVRIVKWRKNEGDAITKGEVVLEAETDKSVIEIESPGAGIMLKRLFEENDTVPVGEVVGYVGQAGENVKSEIRSSKSETISRESEKEESKKQQPNFEAATGERLKASPVAKKIAGKLGVDLHQVAGSGPKGRIVRVDVERHAGETDQGGRMKVSPNAKRLAGELGVELKGIRGSGPDGRIVGADVKLRASTKTTPGAGAKAAPAAGQPIPGTEIEVSKMRRAIGKNLQMSFRDTPHFNVTVPIDMTRAMAFRERINAGREKADRISVNDLVIRGVALALREWPAVNSRFTEEKISYLPDANVGVATALESGLVVPVVMRADERGWDDLAKETKRIVTEARNGKIIGAGKGTFTVSNLGMFGVEEFTAIINPPESAILAVGAVRDEVMAVDGMIGIRPMMRVTLCSDHRVVDGALSAQFLQSVKRYLEEEIE
jgi:pyruvate dehydrogenase E2 component (dihydrolipoamide acetyltransferase)